ncbi:hypothetical protein ACIBEJ_31310 [Nonomuraea sp. NPDC050790]|uniref:hypothetical protein n=1 Tax=Nonomuraea sp. NPDC050790 TaxID=3364371 RepID=UPI00378D13EB
MGFQRLATVLTILLVGGSGTLPVAPPAASAPPSSPKQLIESLMATCMERHGFRYVQGREPVPPTEAERALADGEYAPLLAERSKNGFRLFARFVFPAETGPGGVAAYSEHPNNATIRALSRTQAQAYFEAQASCHAWSAQTALGKKVTGLEDLDRQREAAVRAAQEHTFDDDPWLVAKARDYAACLRAKGRPVTDQRPSQITGQARKPFSEQLWELGRRQWPRIVGNVMPDLTRAEAAPYFAEERRAALDDLECGKDFNPVYLPRANAVEARVNREWGYE